MVSALEIKLVRDLSRMRGQVLTIALVVACGVATFLTFVGAYRSLTWTRDAFYEVTRFGDVFASCVRAPLSLERELVEIPGVAQLETRIGVEATLDLAGVDEPIRARIVSTSRALNTPSLRVGRAVEGPDEALIAEAFAKAHGLRVGDPLHAVIEGRRRTFRLVGLALAPEYVFAIAPGSVTFDDRRYGVVWIDRGALASATGKEGAFDDVSLRLAPGASEGAVRARLTALLKPYGGIDAHGRSDQLSHHFIEQELGELKTWATLLPAIFVGVAAFLLNVVLSRLVGTQREQIAALKAFGYSNARVALHYLALIGVVVALGSVAGVFLGWFLGAGMTDEYTRYFRFPGLSYRLEPSMVLLGCGVTFAAAGVGALGAVRAAVRLTPAEAMRPPAPARYRRSLLERLGLLGLLSNVGRIVSRNLGRRPLRAMASAVGIAFATAIVVDGLYFGDMLDTLLEHQFSRVLREDVSVALRRPVDARALGELLAVPGVLHAEAQRVVPVTLRAGHRDKRVAIVGVPEGHTLRRVLDRRGRPVDVPRDGLLLSAALAELLGVRVGDGLSVEVLEGARVERTAKVSALADEMLGLNAYMRSESLHRLLGEQAAVSLALLRVDASALADSSAALKQLPAVAGVTTHASILASFASMTGSWMLLVSTILSLFAATIAFGVVYNTARINLAERERELASLRVLGFTVGEITTIFAGELAVLVVAGIPLGFLIGRALAWAIVVSTRSEGYHFPLIVTARTLAIAALVVVGSAVLSALLVRGKLDRLDLVGVLKSRD